MNSEIQLSQDERQELLHLYRNGPDPQVNRRAHWILLLDDGHAWRTIQDVTYCSSATLSRWKSRFLDDGVAGLWGEKPGRKPSVDPSWLDIVQGWLQDHTPRAFGLLRTRWCCWIIVLLLWRQHRLKLSRETVRRGLHQAGWRWRRPRPAIRKQDPDYQAKAQALKALVASLPQDEVAVFQDEVDLNLNPEVGAAWMPRGEQATVLTPGDNDKRYLAGSLNWRSGRLIGTLGKKRNSALFIEHLEELRQRLRCYRKIHVICDNARFHDSRAVRDYLTEHEGRIELHFLPVRAPETNPVERVWWKLREQVTRNHECLSMGELVDLVFEWLDESEPFKVRTHLYPRRDAA